LSRSKQRWSRCALGLVVGLVSMFTGAQELEIAVSPSPVGSGARAAGMADAFVAIADDATAASWNPAGLVQLERPEFSFVGSFNAIRESFDSDGVVGFASRHDDQNADINYASIVWPLPPVLGDRNMTISLNYQRKYDFSRRFDVSYHRGQVLRRGLAVTEFTRFQFRQEGGLSTVTPAAAIEITPRLSVGAALNLWRSTPIADNSWSQEIRTDIISVRGGTPLTFSRYSEEHYTDFRGENLSLGVLWNPTSKISVGARYDTAFTGKVDYRLYAWRLDGPFGPGRAGTANAAAKSERRAVRLPASVAVGGAYRFSDRLWAAFDVTRTDWNDFWFQEASGERRSLINAVNIESRDAERFRPTITARLGFERLLLPEELEETLDRLYTLRGGVFYDQEPAAGKPDDFYGAALGIGVLMNQRVNLDAAYQVRFGRGVNRDFFRGIPGFNEDVVQHRVLMSTVIYF